MDSDFCVVVNDGASGVVIDGELGHTTMLQCLNHSCDPNAELRFAWADGCWHAVFYTICDIEPVCARTLIVYLNMNHINKVSMFIRNNINQYKCQHYDW